jgi:hypothetical protein
MPGDRDFMRHDLTALHAFIQSIVGGIADRRSSVVYSSAAARFFDEFVSPLAKCCEKHIEEWAVKDYEDFEDKRGELEGIRAHWRELHILVKPALDADTLQVPSAVVDGIFRRFNELPDCNNTEFALFHTSEFNYIQVQTADLKELARKFSAIIPSAPTFPDNLVLIGMPYSQGRTAFANCLVAHEAGHCLFRGMAPEKRVREAISSAFVGLPGNIKENEKDALIKQITLWAGEIFCDLFGVMLIGPCYTYAYIEAYDLSVVLDREGQVSNERLNPRLKFYAKYPSHLFRLQQQAVFLRESHWWDRIVKTPSRSSRLLDAIKDIPVEAHIANNPISGKFIPVLNATLPIVKEELGRAFDDVDDEYASFSALNSTVQDCLANGVVPSTLNIRTGEGPDDTTTYSASPLVLLNSGMEFYLTRIDELIGSIPDEGPDSFSRRLHWIRRVEEWVAKAIEDQSLGTEAPDGDPVGNNDQGAP